MNARRTAAGGLVAALATAGLIALSGVSYRAAPSDDAVIRLSWRAVGERVERCRIATEEELAALPVHMRRREICEGTLAPFQLDVSIDGEPVHSAEIHAAGAREDRPTYVFEEFRVPPGHHALAVRFAIVADAETAEVSRAPSVLETRVEAAPRAIVLVTLEPGSDELVVRSPVEPESAASDPIRSGLAGAGAAPAGR